MPELIAFVVVSEDGSPVAASLAHSQWEAWRRFLLEMDGTYSATTHNERIAEYIGGGYEMRECDVTVRPPEVTEEQEIIESGDGIAEL